MNFFSLFQLWMLWFWFTKKKKSCIYHFFPFMFAFSFHPLLLHRPPTFSVLWSIRLSVHSQKWLWHLLKRPVECSGLKGYPMLWPKTTCFFFFSLSFPSKTPLWHCALAAWLSDQSLNIFKLPLMKDTPPPLPHTHTHAHHTLPHIRTSRPDNKHTCRRIHVHTHTHIRCKKTQKRAQCETKTTAVLHFQWDFNILYLKGIPWWWIFIYNMKNNHSAYNP